MLEIDDDNKVRTLTLNRPEALNAFNEALYDATATALLAAAEDPDVAVVLLTGAGPAFSAGPDLTEMQARITDPHLAGQEFSFTAMIDAKLVTQAVDLCGEWCRSRDRHHDRRLRRPGVHVIDGSAEVPVHQRRAPEAASSYILPQLIGRQNAAWLLMSSEWVDAEDALRMRLVWKVCGPSALLVEARRHPEIIAAWPISSLMAVKRTIVEPIRPRSRQPGRERMLTSQC